MFKSFLNRSNINRASNRIFEEINCFFIGHQNLQDVSNPVHDDPYTEEWILNQDVTDIVIKDVRISLGYLLPSIVGEKLFALKKKMLLYFLVDELEDDMIEMKRDVQDPAMLVNGKPKIIQIADNFKQTVLSGTLSIIDWWKAIVRKIEIWLGLETGSKTYYLIGNFSPYHYSIENDFSKDSTFQAHKVKLKSGILFHKRN